MARFFRRLFAQSVGDVEPGDFVRRIGFWGVGIVESITDGCAVVAWNKDRRDILPLCSLRRVKPCGHLLDRRNG